MSGTAPYYTQAFFAPARSLLPPGRWRRGRRPDPLPGAARLAGPFRAPNGRRYGVEACEGHRPRWPPPQAESGTAWSAPGVKAMPAALRPLGSRQAPPGSRAASFRTAASRSGARRPRAVVGGYQPYVGVTIKTSPRPGGPCRTCARPCGPRSPAARTARRRCRQSWQGCGRRAARDAER
jgi:hypothetical protein